MTPNEALERTQWDLFWLPSDVRILDRPDVLAVTSARPVPYLNTVLRTRVAPEAIPGLVDEVSAWRAGAGMRWMVPDTFDTAPLVAHLAASGWVPGDLHDARILAVDEWATRSEVRVRAVDSMEVLLDCMEAANGAFGATGMGTPESRAADLAQCVSGHRVHRFVAYDGDGTPVSSGGLTAFPELSMGLLWAGGTVPDARGKGAYLAVLGARIERARALGLSHVGLYAKVDTSSPIVARRGFGRHGEMSFWNAP